MALAEDEVTDDDGAADDEKTDPDGDGDPETETEDDPDGDGSAEAVVLGSVVGKLLGPPLGSAAELEALGDGEGDGEGEGEGDGALEDGSSWHLLSALAEAVVLTSLTESARAMPAQAASMLTIRKPPASKLSVIARTCAKRI